MINDTKSRKFETAERFDHFCKAYDARVVVHHWDEERKQISVFVKDYDASVKIREFSSELGFENYNYCELEEEILLTIIVGDYWDEMYEFFW